MGSLPVEKDDLPSKRDQVLNPLASWMQSRPKFKVLQPVVRADSVLVMNALARE